MSSMNTAVGDAGFVSILARPPPPHNNIRDGIHESCHSHSINNNYVWLPMPWHGSPYKEKHMGFWVRISCINKTDRMSSHERIRNIGGINADGTRWRMPEADAIEGIREGKWYFYVERPPGHRVNVVIAVSKFGNEYLKTEADDEQPDNLLSLPECP
jgi:hypothetical protein